MRKRSTHGLCAAAAGLAVVCGITVSGARLWVKRYNGPGNRDDEAFSLAVSPGGTRVFVTGFSYAGPATGYDAATVAYRP